MRSHNVAMINQDTKTSKQTDNLYNFNFPLTGRGEESSFIFQIPILKTINDQVRNIPQKSNTFILLAFCHSTFLLTDRYFAIC